jgi:hypothetical protein
VNRVVFIKLYKSWNEQAIRLRLFRPVPDSVLDSNPAWAQLAKERRAILAELNKAEQKWTRLCKKRRNWFNLTFLNLEGRTLSAREAALAIVSKRNAIDAKLGALVHPVLCHDCPWDGYTIFPHGRILYSWTPI